MSALAVPRRAVHFIVGGTDGARVYRLRSALAGILAGRSIGTGPTADSEGGGASTDAVDGPRRLLVPIGPHEDPDVLRARLSGRLARVPERADIILRTSGSTTGTGSLVAVSAAALVASARATHERLDGPGGWVLALPAHHVAGLQVLVRSIISGMPPVVVDAPEGFDPGALACGLGRALRRGGPVYVSLVPTQLLRALADPGAAAALVRASAVLVGGAAIDPALLERARTARIRVVTTYGMSETAGGCVYDGVPLAGVGVRIEDPDETGAGRIVVTGPVLAEGYVGRDAGQDDPGVGAGAASGVPQGAGPASDDPPDAPLRRTARSSFLRTDPHEFVSADRGRLEALPDGSTRLTVLGRLDDLIVTGGIKVDPREVEQVLTALPGVARACVVGVPDDVWGRAVVAAVVPEAGARLDGDRLRDRARARLDGAHTPKRILVVPDLPLRGPGKVDRRAVIALFEAV